MTRSAFPPLEEMMQPVAMMSRPVNVVEEWPRPGSEEKKPLIHWFIHSSPEQQVTCFFPFTENSLFFTKSTK